jgi:hypothetical protein
MKNNTPVIANSRQLGELRLIPAGEQARTPRGVRILFYPRSYIPPRPGAVLPVSGRFATAQLDVLQGPL